MPRSIAAAALSERRRGLVGWIPGTLAATSIVVWAFTIVRASEPVQELLTRFPPQMLAALGADVDLLLTAGGFVHTQLYHFIAPLIALTYAIGLGASATTAEEERRTADLLLALPVGRDRVILEKLLAIAALLAAVVLALSAVLLVANAPAGLGLSLSGIAAATAGLYLLALLHGTLALAVGAATGSRALAATAAAVLAFGSFLLEGFAPFDATVRRIVSVLPYDWYVRDMPLLNGFHEGHLLLSAVVGVLAAAAALAFRRRDLQTAFQLPGAAVCRAVSRGRRGAARRRSRLLTSVFGKSLWLRRRTIVAWALGLCGIAAVTMAAWPMLSQNLGPLEAVLDTFPAEIFAAFGLSEPRQLLTAAGFISSRVYATVGLVLMLVFAIGMGSASIAGEERRGTLELQLASPLPRRRIVLEAFGALLTLIAVLGVSLCLVVTTANAAIGLDLRLESIVAATTGLACTGLFFGGLALALGAATGSAALARGVPATLAVGGFLLNALGAVVSSLATLRYLSPIYWFLGDTAPLLRGFSIGPLVLVGASLVAVGIGVIGFERRDVGR